MKLTGWRVVKSKFAATAFTGESARIHGGRWNSPGVRVVYAASSLSLALLELLVNFEREELLGRFVAIPVEFPSGILHSIATEELPKSWRRLPPLPATQAIGNGFIASHAAAILRVPSAVVPLESNFVLNPEHHDFRKVVVGTRQAVRIDRRLV